MDEKIILQLLSRIIAKYLDEIEHEWKSDQRKEISERVAKVAWNGLILLLRQTLTEKQTVTLSELGRFESREGGEWRFLPAASLEEAYSFSLPAQEGVAESARCLLYFLKEAREILAALPSNPKIDFVERVPVIMQSIFGANVIARKFTLLQLMRKEIAHIEAIAQKRLSSNDVEHIHTSQLGDESERAQVEIEPDSPSFSFASGFATPLEVQIKPWEEEPPMTTP